MGRPTSLHRSKKEFAVTDIAQDRDIVQVLQSQHDQVRQMLAKIGKASATDRAGSFQELVTMLKAHEAAEESVVYPAIRGAGGESVANQRIAEEKEAETVIANLQKADPASSEFTEMFNKFQAAVEKHASAEESEVFPLLSKKFDDDKRRSMGSELQQAEQQNGWTPNGRH
jgi:hemerythrin superfamily protein